MDARQLDDCKVFSMLDAISAANTAAATSGTGKWVDMAGAQGDILVVMSLGAMTGGIAGKLQCADDANGTNAVDVTGATFAAGAANTPQILAWPANGFAKRYVGFVGTITTGPSVLGVTCITRGPT